MPEDATNGYALKPSVFKLARALFGGLPGGKNQSWVRKTKYYHRLDFRADGSQTLFTFFNEARSIGVTNLDQPGTIPAGYVFGLQALRFKFTYGFDRNHKRLGVTTGTPTAAQFKGSAMNFGEASATITDNEAAVWKIQEKIRELFAQGIVTLNVAEKPLFEIFGIDSFPSGSGLATSIGASHTMTAAAASNSIQNVMSNVTNGVPVLSNVFTLGTPYPIVAGNVFNVKLNLLNGVDFTETNLGPLNGVATTGTTNAVCIAGVLECDLEGTLICPNA